MCGGRPRVDWATSFLTPRPMVCSAPSRIPTQSFVPLLCTHSSVRWRAREQVARPLGELTSTRPDRRRWSLYALAHLNAALASSDVWRLADDPEPDVRLAVIHTAAVILRDTEPLLLYMATDPDAAVRASARSHEARRHDARTADGPDEPPADRGDRSGRQT
jgi:hypothetical protein